MTGPTDAAAERWAGRWWSAIRARVARGERVADVAAEEAIRLARDLVGRDRPTVLMAWSTTIIHAGDPAIGELVEWFRQEGLEPGDITIVADFAAHLAGKTRRQGPSPEEPA